MRPLSEMTLAEAARELSPERPPFACACVGGEWCCQLVREQALALRYWAWRLAWAMDEVYWRDHRLRCHGPGEDWDYSGEEVAPWRCPHRLLYVYDREYDGWERVNEAEVTEEHLRRGRERYGRLFK